MPEKLLRQVQLLYVREVLKSGRERTSEKAWTTRYMLIVQEKSDFEPQLENVLTVIELKEHSSISSPSQSLARKGNLYVRPEGSDGALFEYS